ncbi:MAG TPA: hypothetical protein VGD90_04965 [Sphingobacteriaceae bacterium]
MKRLTLLILAFVILVFLCILLIIPGAVNKTNKVTVQVPETVVIRHMAMKAGWTKWWPDQKGVNKIDSSSFTFKGVHFRIDKNTFTSIFVTITDGTNTFPSVINLATGENLVSEITWNFTYPTSRNPVKRFLKFERSKELGQLTAELLNHFKNFVEDEKNVYGLDIQYSKVQDSVVATTRMVSSQYPTTKEVYGMVKTLTDFVQQNQIAKNGSPMLNVTQIDDNQYHVMVAVPALRSVKAPNNIQFNRMVLGNILISEVRGGQNTVNKAFTQLKHFIEDSRHTTPAIPFQVLVTNRLTEPDTTKWITRVYFPIL